MTSTYSFVYFSEDYQLFFLGVSNNEKSSPGHVCIVFLVATCKVKPLRSIFVFVLGCMKLENLLFVNNGDFPATTSIGARIVEHRWLDLALHLALWMSVYGIEHPQLSVIFRVDMPLKIHIWKIVEVIRLFDQKLGVFWPSKGGSLVYIKKNLLPSK